MTSPEIIVKGDDRAEFHKRRRSAICGSDVYRICVEGDALGVYLEKKDLVEERPDNEFLRMGRRLERAILEEYAYQNGVTVTPLSGEDAWRTHPQLPWMGGHLDALAENNDGDEWIVDAKNVDLSKVREWGEQGSDRAPEKLATQVNHYAFITGLRRGDLAALFGGNRFRSYVIPYDIDLTNAMLPILDEFWHHNVLKAIPPEPNFDHPAVKATIRHLYPTINEPPLELPADEDFVSLALQFKRCKALVKAAEGKADELDARIRAVLGGSGLATVGETGIKFKRIYNKGGYKPAVNVAPYDYVQVTLPKASDEHVQIPAIAGLLEGK